MDELINKLLNKKKVSTPIPTVLSEIVEKLVYTRVKKTPGCE